MKSTPLGQLADIRTGITFRGAEAAKPSTEGTHSLLRIGDLTEDGEIRADADFPRITLVEERDLRLALAPGDVLFPARGLRTTAALYHRGLPSPAVVGTQFFVIRPESTDLDAGYLAWYFTTTAAQRYFDANRSGTQVQFVSRSALSHFPVPLPPMADQRGTAELAAHLRGEHMLTNRLYACRRRLIEAHLLPPN